MLSGKRRWGAVAIVLALLTAWVLVARSDGVDDGSSPFQAGNSLGGGPPETDGVAAVPADADQLRTWFTEVMNVGDRPVTVLRASVNSAVLAGFEVIPATGEGRKEASFPVVLSHLEHASLYLVATGHGCGVAALGTTELFKPEMKVDYEIGGRRQTRRISLPDTAIVVPRSRPCR
ncbi:MAG TPA: hypothetical protein VNB24_00490 [Acidimicrobiales bacterium]|nr:hypothetical protein [Acidimicrobiales bacterium]